MAVNRKSAAKAAPIEAPLKANPEAAPTPLKSVPKAMGNLYVRLVNGCATYVTPLREVFYSKDSTGKPRIYELTAADFNRVMTYKDDYGRKFFRQVTTPEGETSKPQDINKIVKDVEVKRNARDPDEFNKEGGELDTGAVRLEDENGNSVGVAV